MAGTTAPPPPWPVMLRGVILETRRVVSAHSRHFLTLSVLFLLPVSSLLVAAPSFLLPILSTSTGHNLSPYPTPLLSLFADHHHPSAAAIAVAALSAAAAVLLLSAASASVSNSVHHGFYDRPVRLISAFRSLPVPVGRLLLTIAAAILPICAYLILIASLLLLSLRAVDFFRLPAYLSIFSWSLFPAAASIGLLIFQLNWALAGVIAVLEASWGFAPLRRSADLVKGMRWASLCVYLFFEAGILLVLWLFSLGVVSWPAGEAWEWTEVLPVISKTVFACGITVVMLLYWMVATVVLYIYCKALHGELASEIAQEFAWEYVYLPFDEHKVPHVVSVVLE